VVLVVLVILQAAAVAVDSMAVLAAMAVLVEQAFQVVVVALAMLLLVWVAQVVQVHLPVEAERQVSLLEEAEQAESEVRALVVLEEMLLALGQLLQVAVAVGI
jgi:hypothetical protein